eukprot:GHVU01163547.1.p1 GENE.GHVU01163547.1~~GHVU01163547.1.p1  ORF type:complete len:359 (-),score=41.73 GHVU01163547.1:1698-2774(-)
MPLVSTATAAAARSPPQTMSESNSYSSCCTSNGSKKPPSGQKDGKDSTTPTKTTITSRLSEIFRRPRSLSLDKESGEIEKQKATEVRNIYRKRQSNPRPKSPLTLSNTPPKSSSFLNNGFLKKNPTKEALLMEHGIQGDFRERAQTCPNSILKLSALRAKEQAKARRSPRELHKHASFQENVDVFYYKSSDRTTSQSQRDISRLKEEPCKSTVAKDDLYLDIRGILKYGYDDPNSNGESGGKDGGALGEIFHVLGLDFIEGQDGRKKMSLTLRVGQDCIREKTLVKAMSGGRRIIIMTYRNEETEDGEKSLHQFVERMTLPCLIDAFSVRANVDTDMVLTIEAPVLECFGGQIDDVSW